VRLQRLALTNFRLHAATDITFGPGVTGVIGPNGAGKTTLLEAIAWAFYGTPAARGGRDTLRWFGARARSPAQVEVEFALGDREFRVVRSEHDAMLFLGREAAPIARGGTEVTAQAQRLLGMKREEFFNTYFAGQKELAVMATMGPTERGKFLSRILGYERLRLAQDQLRARRAELKGELAGLEAGLGDAEALERERAEAEAKRKAAGAELAQAESALAAATTRRDAVGPAWTAMAGLRDKVLALDGDRRVAEKDVVEARREFERLDRELAAALEAQAALRELEPQLSEVAPLRAELERLDEQARAAGQRRQLMGQLAERRAQYDRMTERRSAMGDPAAAIRAAEARVAEERSALDGAEREEDRGYTSWVTAKQDAQTKLDEARRQYGLLREDRQRIEQAGPDGTCPTCSRPLKEEYDTVLATLGRQLEEIELNGKYFRQRVEQLEPEPTELGQARRRVADARAALESATAELARARTLAQEAAALDDERAKVAAGVADLEQRAAALPEQYDVERHDVVRGRLKALEPAMARGAELKVRASRAEALVHEAEAADKALSRCEARVAALVAAIAELGFSEQKFKEARETYEAAERALRDAEVLVVNRRADAKAAGTAVEAAARRLAERAARASRADTVRADLRAHDALDEALGDLRTALNAQLRPELSELASGFLADLTDGRYHELELDDQYRVLVLEDGQPRPVISGGEEDIANLVLRLAISQMVAERAGQPLSLLVLDEIFGSLDESRRQHVVALLRRLADRFPQVILITHIESVRDSVDRVLRVTLDPDRGCARVTENGGADEDVAA
jgi:exonuclease SbcC